jgi:3-oxoacyl-[acyl-carrier protein] reductase
MDLRLTDRVALVTGASRGIGAYIAEALAREGCAVGICARSEEDLAETADRIRDANGVPVYEESCDLTEPKAPGAFVEQAAEALGGVDIYVGNVGGNQRGTFMEVSDADWDDIIDLNLKSHIRASRAAIPHMRDAGGGSICYISSIFGRELGGAGLSLYNTTKSALISMGKVMAQELTPEGIRVNTVAPGSIRFPGGSWDRRVKEDPEAMQQFVEENLPIGRFGRAEEVADAVAFLVSERASLITGACINVDGGQSHSLI